MLEVVSFKNFKALRDIEVPLSPFTLLIGPNASGKSSVLQGIDLIAHAVSLRNARGVFADQHSPVYLRTHDSVGPMVLRARTAPPSEATEVEINISNTPSDSDSSNRWQFGLSFKPQTKLPNLKIRSQKTQPEFPEFISKRWPKTQALRLNPFRLAEPAIGGFPIDALEADGYGLASLLATLKASAASDFDALVEATRSVIPNVRGIQLSPTSVTKMEYSFIEAAGLYAGGEHNYTGWSASLILDSGAVVSANAVSEGTLLTLGLLAAVLAPDCADVLLLDDLERGLHPKALKDFMSQIRNLLARFPRLQIVATTHSPYLVDLCEPDEVRLMSLKGDGSTVCGVLAEHPEFGKWRQEMLPGEFWSMVGEKWLLERATMTP